MATYIYPITSFINDSINIDRFKSSIVDSAIVPVFTDLFITIEGVHVEFDSSLPPGDETILGELVGAHDGADLNVDNIPASLLSSYDSTSSEVGLEGVKILTGLSVGRLSDPYPLYVGEGAPEAYTMQVLQQPDAPGGTGAWTDITSSLLSTDGISTEMFAGTLVNNGVYIGADRPFGGMHFLTDAGGDHGPSDLVVEYSGPAASWLPVDHMSTNSTGTSDQYANNTWTRDSSLENVRFGPVPNWTSVDVDGSSKYWVRIYLSSASGANPSLHWLRLHTDSAAISQSGVLEFFGDTRLSQVRHLTWDQKLQQSVPGQSPGSGTVNYSTNISGAGSGNRFVQGAQDGFAGSAVVPAGFDTSHPISFFLKWLPVAATTGDVEFKFRYTVLSTGDTVDGTAADTEVVQTVSLVPGDQNLMQETLFTAYIPMAGPGDLFIFNIERDAGAGNVNDTYEANVDVISHRISGVFWR